MSTGACVIMVITSHGPTPPEVGMYYHQWDVTRSPPLLYSPGKRDPAHLSRGFSFTNSWCPQWEIIR
ncbi:hypothetical protein AVEN_200588-1, partial [Araneus ventricosus]